MKIVVPTERLFRHQTLRTRGPKRAADWPQLLPALSRRSFSATGRTSASDVWNQLRTNFHCKDRRTFVKLRQHVRPHLDFASPAWSPWKVQWATMISNLRRCSRRRQKCWHYREEYKKCCGELGLQTMKERRLEQDLNLTTVPQGLHWGRRKYIFFLTVWPEIVRTRMATEASSQMVENRHEKVQHGHQQLCGKQAMQSQNQSKTK